MHFAEKMLGANCILARFKVTKFEQFHSQAVSISVEMTKRDVPGFAIGGLSGGEEKDDFWRMVSLSTDHLPREKPRYLMGVGYVWLCKLKFIMITVPVN